VQDGAVDYTTDNGAWGLQGADGAGGCRVGTVMGACRQVMGAHWCIGWCSLLGAPGVWLGAHTCYKGHTWVPSHTQQGTIRKS